MEASRETLPTALIVAVCTGSFVALFTKIDAYGIRVAGDPIAFIVWFFLIDSLSITPYAFYRWNNLAQKPNIFLCRSEVLLVGYLLFLVLDR